MAKKGGARPETKSEFLRKILGKDPDLDYQQVNRRWSKEGHAGQISNALYYKDRAELGIKTEWAWVKEEPETRGSQKPGPERGARPNDDLVEAAESFLPQILMFYKRFEDKRPVMVLGLTTEGKLAPFSGIVQSVEDGHSPYPGYPLRITMK